MSDQTAILLTGTQVVNPEWQEILREHDIELIHAAQFSEALELLDTQFHIQLVLSKLRPI